jgi:uncharacterized membrane protein
MMGIGLLILLAIAAGVYYLANSSGKPSQNFFRGEEPHDQILDRRYARGEISREEYQQLKNDLDI